MLAGAAPGAASRQRRCGAMLPQRAVCIHSV